VTHPPLHKIERFMLVIVIAQFGYIAWSLWSGPWKFSEANVLGRLVVVASVLIACIAFALIVTRNPSGWMALMVFYLPQLPRWDMDGVTYWQLYFLPTIFGRVFDAGSWKLHVNLVALLFFAICFPVWQLRKKANATGAMPYATGGA
jgi:hypothetical protein